MGATKNGSREGRRSLPLPSRVSLARSVRSSAHHSQAPATQGSLKSTFQTFPHKTLRTVYTRKKAGSTGKEARQTFFDDRVVVKAKRVTLFPETLFSHIDVALPRSQVFPVYPAMQWHLKLVPSTEQVALL